jgi:hypothetical protein
MQLIRSGSARTFRPHANGLARRERHILLAESKREAQLELTRRRNLPFLSEVLAQSTLLEDRFNLQERRPVSAERIDR